MYGRESKTLPGPEITGQGVLMQKRADLGWVYGRNYTLKGVRCWNRVAVDPEVLTVWLEGVLHTRQRGRCP